MKFSASVFFYAPFDIAEEATATQISQYLMEIGHVPELENTDNSILQLRWSKSGFPTPSVETAIFFDRIGREAPLYGSGFGGPVTGNYIPVMSFTASNRNHASSGLSSPLWTPRTWNHLAFAADWSTGDRWGFSQSPGFIPFQIHTLWATVLNGLDISISTKPGYDNLNYPLRSTGDSPTWEYANNDGYGGEPLPDITSRTYAMDVSGEQIGILFNENDPAFENSFQVKNNKSFVLSNFQVWFGKYIDWSDTDNLDKVVRMVDGSPKLPIDMLAAKAAFGTPDVWLHRDSSSGTKFEDNQGTSGAFEAVGTKPQDFFPGP